MTRGRLPQRAGLPGLNGSGAAAAVAPSSQPSSHSALLTVTGLILTKLNITTTNNTIDLQATENSPYPLKLYLPPKIRYKKFGLAGYQPNFDEELAAGKIPAIIRLIGLANNCSRTFCITPCLKKSSTSYFAKYCRAGLTDCKNFNGYRVRDNKRTQVCNQCFNF